jgi:hypothetical protein
MCSKREIHGLCTQNGEYDISTNMMIQNKENSTDRRWKGLQDEANGRSRCKSHSLKNWGNF